MRSPKKVLFCYISPASGHRRAAEAVMGVLRHSHPPVECEGINSISYANPILGHIVSRVYLKVLKYAPQLWDFLYDNPKVEKATRDLRELLHLFNTRRIEEILRESRPNCLVCTQAVPVGLLAAMKERGKIRVPVVGIITDFGVHNYWLSPQVDLYLAPSEEVRRRIIRSGILEERVRVVGIPTDPHFGAAADKRAERVALGLHPNRPTVLVMGGNYGLGPMEDVVSALRRLPVSPQVVAVCGNNRSLLRKMHSRFAGDRFTLVLGHSRAVHRLMDAADLLISKPGGLTTAESLAKGLPMVIIQPIPGQEERNAQFLLRHGAAERADTLDDLTGLVQSLLANRARLDRLRDSGRPLARPRAAFDAAEAIRSLMDEPPRPEGPGPSLKELLWAVSLAFASTITRLLPDRGRYVAARALGRLMGRIFADKRRAVEANLEVIQAWSGRRFSVDKVFENFGMTLSDFLSRREVEIEVIGREKAERAMAAGKGVLFLTTHLGNWEMGGRVLAGFGWPVTAVYQPYASHAMQNFIQRHRAERLNYLAVGKGAARGVAKLLEHREAVAMLADRPFGEEGVPVSLCGRPARLPRGPFLFAGRFGAPVVPGFILMDRPGHYQCMVEDPVFPSGKGAHSVQNLLDNMALVLEKYLASHADQWYCFEKVWDS